MHSFDRTDQLYAECKIDNHVMNESVKIQIQCLKISTQNNACSQCQVYTGAPQTKIQRHQDKNIAQKNTLSHPKMEI